MNTVEFFSLQRHHAELSGEINSAALRVIHNGRFILGPELERFEHDFAAYCGTKHAVGVGNGLDALKLLLKALGVGRGDEVIVPAHTFIATWLAVEEVGATVVPVDVRPDTYNIDASEIAAAITARTRAIIVVHLYGQPVDMHSLVEISANNQIPIIEDAAQAHGATFDGKRAGNLGVAAAFSFYPTKNLGALGDGGAITTNDDSIARRVRSLRNYGSSIKYCHDDLGGNSRLDELQAAYLLAKLARLETKNARRGEIAAQYTAALTGAPGIELPVVARHACPVWHLYVVRLSRRVDVQRELSARGIQTMVHYPVPPHQQPAYRGTALSRLRLPHTELAAEQVLSLPMWPELTDSEIKRVIDVLLTATQFAAKIPAVS